MKLNFASYPEVLCIDATYKLNDLRMPVYLMLTIDGNGQSDIVAVFITANETKCAITKMVESFKAANRDWVDTRVIISDKDFLERDVFRAEFPNASVLICLFHVLRSFRREVTCEKLGLRVGERDHALELITKLLYSKSEAEYNNYYDDLLKSNLKSVIHYYNTNWHLIRHEWVECFKGANFTLGEKTNNRLESINAKVKSVCSKYASLSKFFDQFFAVLSCLRNERDHESLMAMAKKKVIPLEDVDEKQYAELLTPYAFNFLQKQFNLKNKVKFTESGVLSSEGTLTVTEDSCHCKFWSTMHLPCRHIFAVRESLNKPLFCSTLVSERWKLSYLRSAFNRKKSSISMEGSLTVSYLC